MVSQFGISSSLLRLSAGTVKPSFAACLERVADACQASCSSRSYATQGTASPASRPAVRQFRRQMRYGSKLAIRNPEQFRRMRAMLGYPSEESVRKVPYVTINLLQTMKYLMNTPENRPLLEGIASYKVTSLNRELAPWLERTDAFLAATSPSATEAKK